METKKMKRSVLEAAAMNSDVELEGFLREGYSGRGMFGKTCFGFVGSQTEVLRFVAALGAIAMDEETNAENPDLDPQMLDDMLGRSSSDSMGRSAITYFPGWEIED